MMETFCGSLGAIILPASLMGYASLVGNATEKLACGIRFAPLSFGMHAYS